MFSVHTRIAKIPENMIEWRSNQSSGVMNGRLFEGYTLKGHVNQNLSHQYNSPFTQQGDPPLFVASNGNTMPSLLDLEKLPGGVAFPQKMSSECFYAMDPREVGPTFTGTLSNPTSGNSYWTRSGELVENNHTLNHVGSISLFEDIVERNRHRALLLSKVQKDTNAFSSNALSNPMINCKPVSQCEVQTLLSKQRHFQPCPPHPRIRPYQSQTNGFIVRSKNTQQQGFGNVQAPKPANPTLIMHNILISYINHKYKLIDACKSQQVFLDRLHWMACRGGICKCENPRALISHFENCQDTYCSICGPVRQVCFSGGVHYRDYVIQESQPTCKRMKMENTVHNDDWSLGAIIGHHLKQQLSKDPINIGRRSLLSSNHAYGDDKKTGNDNPVSHFEGISGVVEMRETGCVDTSQVKSYGLGLNYDEKCDLAEPDCQFRRRSEDLKKPTLNKETLSSIGNIGESFLCSNYAFDDKTPSNENDVSHCEEITAIVEMQETGCVDTCQVKSYGQNLNSDGKCDIVKSDCQSGLKLEDLKQTKSNKEIPGSIDNFLESILSDSYSFEDIYMENENVCSDPKKINRALEEQETGCVDTGRANSYRHSLNSDDKGDLAKSDCQSGKNSEDLKVTGVSLIDFFTPEQIKEHLHSLNQNIHPSSVKGLTADTCMRTVDKNTCQLCDVSGLLFAPLPMHCTCCGGRIKHGLNYYRPPEDETSVKHSFCSLCFKASRGGNISFKGFSFSKANLEKCKYTDEIPEGWVQCDKCEGWQHQICALYNAKQDLEGKSEYVCPFCRLLEREAKGYASIRPAFGAHDLPRTKLSDHIEERLFRSLEKERKRRAELLGTSPEEVPGAEDLVVRVVLAVNEKLNVKQQFLDILHGETYPTEFPFKSKVLLLFQKFEGVDVCIFAMHLQEFGSECGHPNNRSIYISYLDSVKYFRPEIKTVDGVALRTFVYHEILIGYLDYCKQHGFITCYIWACPPIRGEDYILYCHPKTQKTPNPHKLLQWYKKLLRKANEENVVVEYTNFYDYFFVPSGECNSKITAARLPYFDGDYWSRAIDNMIQTIDKESEGAPERKLKIKTSKRALRAMGHSELSDDKTKDILVMQKLGQTILPLKEDFFVVHLQFTCINCHEPILSGSRWSCKQCSKFHLCHRCLELEPNSTQPERTHTSIHGETHHLFEIQVNDVATDTEDNDVILDNDLFNNRESFLKLCQENHYQFDTLRRAKYSSMMILHHLQNSTALLTNV